MAAVPTVEKNGNAHDRIVDNRAFPMNPIILPAYEKHPVHNVLYRAYNRGVDTVVEVKPIQNPLDMNRLIAPLAAHLSRYTKLYSSLRAAFSRDRRLSVIATLVHVARVSVESLQEYARDLAMSLQDQIESEDSSSLTFSDRRQKVNKVLLLIALSNISTALDTRVRGWQEKTDKYLNISYESEWYKKIFAKLAELDLATLNDPSVMALFESCWQVDQRSVFPVRSIVKSVKEFGMIIAACYNLRDIKNVKPSSWLAELIGLSILVASADDNVYTVRQLTKPQAQYYTGILHTMRSYIGSSNDDRELAKDLRLCGAEDYILAQADKYAHEAVPTGKEMFNELVSDFFKRIVIDTEDPLMSRLYKESAFYKFIKEQYSVVNLFRQTHKSELDAEKFFSIQPRVLPGQEIPYTCEPGGMKIEFVDVSFKFPDADKYQLHNLSFTINPGEIVTLQGRNGSGKSTLIDLLCQNYHPTSGKILINGQDMLKYKPADLYRNMSCLFQTNGEFKLTFREFVTLGMTTEPTDEEIYEAAERAGIKDQVKEWPEKLDSLMDGRRVYVEKTPEEHVHEVCIRYASHFGGIPKEELPEVTPPWSTVLSEGSLQKVCLTRCLLRKDCHLRIFDEVTGPLDALAKREIYKLFHQQRGKCTTIMTSHDVRAPVKLADKILVLQDGKLVEEGNYDELMKLEGIVYNMVKAQEADPGLMEEIEAEEKAIAEKLEKEKENVRKENEAKVIKEAEEKENKLEDKKKDEEHKSEDGVLITKEEVGAKEEETKEETKGKEDKEETEKKLEAKKAEDTVSA